MISTNTAASVLADEPAAKLSKRAAIVLPSLEQGLQEIVDLRLAGETRAADEKLRMTAVEV